MLARRLTLLVLLVGCAQSEVRPAPRPMRHQEPDARVEARLALLEPPSLKPQGLLPGDEIALHVLGEPELSMDSIRVLADGTVGVPLVGAWPAQNKMVATLQEELRAAYARWLKTPRVAVVPVSLASQRFSVVGMVNEPGSFELQRPMRLMDAVAVAGGIRQGLYRSSTVSLADFSQAFLARDGRILPVDFARLFRDGDLSHNAYVRPGDLVYIPSSLDAEIFVLGQVVNPRAYSFRSSATLVQVLTHAGGLAPGAKGSEVRVVRGGLSNPEVYVIDVDSVLEGKAADIPLSPGDVVFVPRTALSSWNEVVTQILPTLEGLARLKYLSVGGF